MKYSLLALCLFAVLCRNVAATDADQYIADKEFSVAAIVVVEAIDNRWWVIEHGDHVPVHLVRAKCDELLKAGDDDVTTGSSFDVLQFGLGAPIFGPTSPPVQLKRRYLLLAGHNEPAADDPEWLPRLIALPDGLYGIRGIPGEEFIWISTEDGHMRIALDDLRRAIAAPAIPLIQIDNFKRRVKTAANRLEAGQVDDFPGFVAAVHDAAVRAQAQFDPRKKTLKLKENRDVHNITSLPISRFPLHSKLRPMCMHQEIRRGWSACEPRGQKKVG